MKLPLRYGLAALAAIWAGYGFIPVGPWRMVALVAAMGVALWTAFSLKIPPRRPGDPSGALFERRVPERDEDPEPPRRDA